MNKILCLFMMMATTIMNSFAQSKMYSYKNAGMCNRTITAIPGGGYAASESSYWTAEGGIHFTIYDQSGNILVDNMIDEPGVFDKNVDIFYYEAGGVGYFLITALHQVVQPQMYDANIALIQLDMSGNILQQTLVKSNNPDYPGLYPLDAAYDANQEVFVICGTAAVPNDGYHNEPSRDLQKQAFVAKVDANFNPLDIRFYNSNANGGVYDHDIATRVVITKSNDYYVMGSENVDDGNGNHATGIRNMLIDENNLAVIWSKPIILDRPSSQENSVDMVEVKTNYGQEFAVLVNSTTYQIAKWWLIRINPSNGNSLYNNFETLSPTSYAYPNGVAVSWDIGYSLHQGNKPNEIVVSGIKIPTYNRQCHTMDLDYTIYRPEAIPFAATFNMISYPTTVLQHIEYYSILAGPSAPYWGNEGGALYINFPFGGIAQNVAYPQVNFLGRFMDREGPGKPYGLITHCKDVFITKFLDVNANTVNGCDDVSCVFTVPESPMRPRYPVLDLSETPDMPLMDNANKSYSGISYDTYDECANGAYKQSNSTIVKNIDVRKITVYPNPASDHFTVKVPTEYMDKTIQIKLLDLTGKVIADFGVRTIESSTTQVRLPENIADGLYLLNLSFGEVQKQFKITILK